jgi:hypothetical protein
MPGMTVLTISFIKMKRKAMSDMVVPPGTNGFRRSARSTLGTRFSLQKYVLRQSTSGQRLCCVSQQTHHVWIRPPGSVPQPRSLSIPRRHPDGLACGLPAASSAGQSLARGAAARPAARISVHTQARQLAQQRRKRTECADASMFTRPPVWRHRATSGGNRRVVYVQ